LDLYCTDNYRTEQQLEEMRRLEAAEICLFCPAPLREHARQRVILETAHWSVTPNEYPYKGTLLHLLVVPHQHVNDMLDLDEESLADFWTVLKTIRERFGLGHYGLGVRNGNCSFTGATIAHVHAHVLVGDPALDPEVPVRMRFSSRPRP
jgi:ATP adenylyltransferase